MPGERERRTFSREKCSVGKVAPLLCECKDEIAHGQRKDEVQSRSSRTVRYRRTMMSASLPEACGTTKGAGQKGRERGARASKSARVSAPLLSLNGRKNSISLSSPRGRGAGEVVYARSGGHASDKSRRPNEIALHCCRQKRLFDIWENGFTHCLSETAGGWRR